MPSGPALLHVGSKGIRLTAEQLLPWLRLCCYVSDKLEARYGRAHLPSAIPLPRPNPRVYGMLPAAA